MSTAWRDACLLFRSVILTACEMFTVYIIIIIITVIVIIIISIRTKSTIAEKQLTE